MHGSGKSGEGFSFLFDKLLTEVMSSDEAV